MHVIHCLSGVLLYRRYGQYCVHIPGNGRGITQRGGGSRGSARVHRFEIKQVCDPVRRREVSDTLRAPLHTASVETRKEQLQSELAQHKCVFRQLAYFFPRLVLVPSLHVALNVNLSFLFFVYSTASAMPARRSVMPPIASARLPTASMQGLDDVA